MEEMNQYEHVTSEFDLQKDTLERQIISIELRQQEIQLHISNIEQANNHIDTLIQQEKDARRKGKYFQAKTRNIEILTKLYSVYREFEDTKFKFHNSISDMIVKGHKMIEVDIRRIDEKLEKMTGDDMVDMFKSLADLFGQNKNELPKELLEEVKIDGDEFRM